MPPTDRCGSCRKFISSTEGVKCNKCTLFHHKACVALSTKANISVAWKCPECSKGEPRNNKDDTPVRGSSLHPANMEDTSDPNPLDGCALITPRRDNSDQGVTNKDILQEIRALRLDFSHFQKEMSDLKIEVRSCLTRIDKLETRIETLEKQPSVQRESCDDVSQVIAQLRADLNDRDQDVLSNDLEIRNIPEERGENPIHLVVTVATKLGVNLEDRDIVSAERIGGRFLNATSSEGPVERRPRPLVVRLGRHDLREKLLQSAKVRRTSDTDGMGFSQKPVRFYINERLTKQNRLLFRQARDAGRRNGWQYVWTKRGRIFARRKSDDPVVRLRVENDIIKHIGLFTESVQT